jgi:group I intron endonuclease
MIIYKITNHINNKVYIGQTIQTNPKMRWYSHQADARKGKKSHLYDSMRKHGVENFVWEVIAQAESIEELNKLEANWLAHFRILGEVYNNREAGNNKLHSEESIQRMKEAQKQAHARRREANGVERHSQHKQHSTGWKHSEESKLKRKEWSSITNKIKARPLSEEHKRKVSESGKLAWVTRKQQISGGI